MRLRPLTISVVLIASCGRIGFDPVLLDEVGPNDNAYVCSCSCKYQIGPVIVGQSSADFSICLPLELNPNVGGVQATPEQVQTDCRDRIQPVALAIAQAKEGICGLDCECLASALFSTINDAACNVACDPVPLPADPTATDLKTSTFVPAALDPGCGRTEDTVQVCQVPDADPPELQSQGLISSFFGARSFGIVTSGQARIFFGDIDPITTELAGEVEFSGGPCPGETCDVGFSFALSAASFSRGSFLGSVQFVGLRLVGATTPRVIALDVLGNGVLPTGQARATARATAIERGLFGIELGRETRAYLFTNNAPIDVSVDWTNHHFEIIDEFVANTDPPIRFEMTFAGIIVNEPPITRAGADHAVECTSAEGAEHVLNGSASSDAQANIAAYSWRPAITLGTPSLSADPSQPVVTVLQAIGVQEYTLGVTDRFFASSDDQVTVSVVDTVPPEITDVELATDCLWEPNHRFHLLRLGEELRASATDLCDLEPALRIIDVTSNQPVDATGDGHSAPDIRFGSGAVCLRAERQGNDPNPREYRITLEARDASDNAQITVAIVRVLHDQSPEPCLTGDLAPVVRDDDPRCEALAPEPERPAAVGPRAVPGPAPGSSPPEPAQAGCRVSLDRGSSPWTAALLVGLVLWRLARRRRRPRC